jgi:crossover junction endodeoxyribonuclease RuvC
MKILGIDPGYERLGVAIIEKPDPHIGGREIVVFSDCIRTSSKSSMQDRLFEIGQALSLVIKKYQPDVVAIEELYFAKNTKTAMTVAEARGVIQYICKECGLEVFEYHPNQIKIAITGDGHADKTSIAFMIPRLVAFDTREKIDDEIDAIAVGLTYLAHAKNTYPQIS